MPRSTLPLFPSDDGWPYPDADYAAGFELTAEPDLDALELRVDRHAFDDLTELERAALFTHFGFQEQAPVSMKDLADALGCNRSEAREALGIAIDKVRRRLQAG